MFHMQPGGSITDFMNRLSEDRQNSLISHGEFWFRWRRNKPLFLLVSSNFAISSCLFCENSPSVPGSLLPLGRKQSNLAQTASIRELNLEKDNRRRTASQEDCHLLLLRRLAIHTEIATSIAMLSERKDGTYARRRCGRHHILLLGD